ncbi:MAG: CoA-binding protein [Lewinellaceae bacterium]|nr:CoA-binding protein [Saprospiraceae bacterium]MCB9312124.1 CoA-binding protein [Lewinellaceae bacterium]
MKTLVIGASPNPMRYAYSAVEQLRWKGHEVVAIGHRKGRIEDVDIQLEWPEEIPDLDTITLYIGPDNQAPVYDRILGYRPRRIIFNPGTENPVLMRLAAEAGIEVVRACTLVMLSIGNYDLATDPANPQ